MEKEIINREHVVVKFAGDSGDGIQLTGSQMFETSAFQLHFGKSLNEFNIQLTNYRLLPTNILVS